MARFINNAAADDTGLFPNTDPDDEEEEEGNEDGSEMGGFIDDGPEPGSESEREHEPEHEPDLHGSSSPPPLPGKLGQVVARWEAVNASPEVCACAYACCRVVVGSAFAAHSCIPAQMRTLNLHLNLRPKLNLSLSLKLNPRLNHYPFWRRR
jgi:hypothetical protein